MEGEYCDLFGINDINSHICYYDGGRRRLL